MLGYELLHMKDYTREIKAVKIIITTEPALPLSQPLYRINPSHSSIRSVRSLETLALAENSRIVDAHYGLCGEYDR